jgi:hypothetical protein
MFGDVEMRASRILFESNKNIIEEHMITEK